MLQNTDLGPAGRIHVSAIGLIPKPHQPGRFRLIVDLSAPEGGSVNDGVSPALCSLQYASVVQAAQMVKQLGRGAVMAKLDLKSAYRMVPVHSEDRSLLCGGAQSIAIRPFPSACNLLQRSLWR